MSVKKQQELAIKDDPVTKWLDALIRLFIGMNKESKKGTSLATQ